MAAGCIRSSQEAGADTKGGEEVIATNHNVAEVPIVEVATNLPRIISRMSDYQGKWIKGLANDDYHADLTSFSRPSAAPRTLRRAGA